MGSSPLCGGTTDESRTRSSPPVGPGRRLETARENAYSAMRWRRKCDEVDCLPVRCGAERHWTRPVIAWTESRAQSSERARGSPPEISATGPGAILRRARRAESEPRKDHAVTRRRQESATGLLQSAT